MAVRRNTRAIVGAVAALLILVPLAVMWLSSLVPASYSVMGMGRPEFGGGPADRLHSAHANFGWDGPPPGADEVSVATLAGPDAAAPDIAVELVARAEQVRLDGAPDGAMAAYTLNDATPGPIIHATQGDLVQVRLVNESVPDGVTLHWHGVDVPNAEDGVAGVTQDAVRIGGSHTYRFVAEDAGTYWYHSHQVSHEQVRGGLFGVLVVAPPSGSADHDVVAAFHTYGSTATLNGAAGEHHYVAGPGQSVRIRVVNTDSGVLRMWVAGAPFQVVAVDGRDINAPTPVTEKALVVAAGGRADVQFTVPADGSAVLVGVGATALVVGPERAVAPPAGTPPAEVLDLLQYGSPAGLGFDPARPDRVFDYRIGRRPGFVDGRPGMFWTINGRMYPDVPMFVVSEGDVVRMSIENSRADNHPMHLHGHHAVVLARNGVPASGSPWLVDSIEVGRGESYEIAFVADNPGIWMDHCHDLEHAADGLVAHLAYTGVYTPFRIGGPASNEPE
ncbi:MAG TPA: multicopper oxidase family protein [Jiangellales bacterium]|nr:multicopper oxidase family protein [Jiangellales bacterium]